MKIEYYGIFGIQVLPDLATPDKQLHGGPYPILNDFYFESAAHLIAFLEREIPEETFTMVIDTYESFDNDYWKNGPSKFMEDE